MNRFLAVLGPLFVLIALHCFLEQLVISEVRLLAAVATSLAVAICQHGHLPKQLLRSDIQVSLPFIYRCTFHCSKVLARWGMDDPCRWFQRFHPVVRLLRLFPILPAHALTFHNALDNGTYALLASGTLFSLRASACTRTSRLGSCLRSAHPMNFRAGRHASTGASRSGLHSRRVHIHRLHFI